MDDLTTRAVNKTVTKKFKGNVLYTTTTGVANLAKMVSKRRFNPWDDFYTADLRAGFSHDASIPVGTRRLVACIRASRSRIYHTHQNRRYIMRVRAAPQNRSLIFPKHSNCTDYELSLDITDNLSSPPFLRSSTRSVLGWKILFHASRLPECTLSVIGATADPGWRVLRHHRYSPWTLFTIRYAGFRIFKASNRDTLPARVNYSPPEYPPEYQPHGVVQGHSHYRVATRPPREFISYILDQKVEVRIRTNYWVAGIIVGVMKFINKFAGWGYEIEYRLDSNAPVSRGEFPAAHVRPC